MRDVAGFYPCKAAVFALTYDVDIAALARPPAQREGT